jgi:hypothetical protein
MPANILLQVPEPCHEDWMNMTAIEQGRFCQSCQKTVTDFSLMTDKEILLYLSNKGTAVCGRFTNDQLNRNLAPDQKKKFSWAYIWNIVLATLLTTSAVHAQSKPAPVKKTSVSKNTKSPNEGELIGTINFIMPDQLTLVEGVVIDSQTNLPIPFASVLVKGTKSGVAADANGKFKLNVLFHSKEIVLLVSSVGYQAQEFVVNNKPNAVSFFLEPMASTLGEFQATALPEMVINTKIECTPIIAGMLVARKEVDLAEKIERRITEFTPEVIKKKEVKLSPNPVIAGHSVNIELSVKEPGVYTIEIIDTEGRIVYRDQVIMQSKEQTISVPTHASWSKGIYWVRVSGNNSQKIFHAKMVVKGY